MTLVRLPNVISLFVQGEAATKVMDQHPAFAEQH